VRRDWWGGGGRSDGRSGLGHASPEKSGLGPERQGESNTVEWRKVSVLSSVNSCSRGWCVVSVVLLRDACVPRALCDLEKFVD
jgi:hypothetical protein